MTSAWLAFSHGANDSQKVVGVIAGMLVATGSMSSLSDDTFGIIVACSVALTLGTALGGWRIVKTIG